MAAARKSTPRTAAKPVRHEVFHLSDRGQRAVLYVDALDPAEATELVAATGVPRENIELARRA